MQQTNQVADGQTAAQQYVSASPPVAPERPGSFAGADAAQQLVSSDELVRALTAIEMRSEDLKDHIKIGDAIRQLGLDVSPESVLAEIESQRASRQAGALEKALRIRNRIVMASVILAIVIVTLFLAAGDSLRSARHGRSSYSRAVSAGFGPEFDSLIASFRSNTYDPGRLAFVRSIASSRRFSTGEVRFILSEMTYDDGRLKAAEALYPSVLDKQNFHEVLQTFTYDRGREDLLKWIGAQR